MISVGNENMNISYIALQLMVPSSNKYYINTPISFNNPYWIELGFN